MTLKGRSWDDWENENQNHYVQWATEAGRLTNKGATVLGLFTGSEVVVINASI